MGMPCPEPANAVQLPKWTGSRFAVGTFDWRSVWPVQASKGGVFRCGVGPLDGSVWLPRWLGAWHGFADVSAPRGAALGALVGHAGSLGLRAGLRSPTLGRPSCGDGHLARRWRCVGQADGGAFNVDWGGASPPRHFSLVDSRPWRSVEFLRDSGHSPVVPEP